MAEERKSIGGLWLKDGKNGKYFSGEIELFGTKTHIFIFKNIYKEEGSKQPDYRIVLPREENSPSEPKINNDDVPF